MINRFARRKLHYQEMEGRVIAKEILERLNVQKEIIEEVYDTMGHPHSLGERETLHFQILHEADWLVNIKEGISKDRGELEKAIKKVFETATGRPLAENLISLLDSISL
jgi:hypothetical protein